MISLLVGVLAAASLGAPFGDAAAVAEPDGDYIAVTVSVQVDPEFNADYVVVHLLNPEGQETFSLAADGNGLHSGLFTVLPFNRAVVFEAGREDGRVVSETISILELGVDADLLYTTFQPDGDRPAERSWGWLALASGALAAGALMAFFLIPKKVDSRRSTVD